MLATKATAQPIANSATLFHAQQPGRNMPHPCAWVLCIQIAIYEPVEGHRDTPREDHAQQHAQQIAPMPLRSRFDPPGHQGRQQGNGSANSVWLNRIISRKRQRKRKRSTLRRRSRNSVRQLPPSALTFCFPTVLSPASHQRVFNSKLVADPRHDEID